jgi:hypothetical protein
MKPFVGREPITHASSLSKGAAAPGGAGPGTGAGGGLPDGPNRVGWGNCALLPVPCRRPHTGGNVADGHRVHPCPPPCCPRFEGCEWEWEGFCGTRRTCERLLTTGHQGLKMEEGTGIDKELRQLHFG